MTSPTANSTLRASLYMVIAMASFVSNDTMVKLVGTSMPVGEIVLIRGFMTILFIGAICLHQRAFSALPHMMSKPVMLRASLDLSGTLLFVTALMHMEIANLTAVLQVVPLAVAFLSALILGEQVGWRRLAAIAVGFIGVLLIVKPAPSTFSIYEVMALGIVLSVAFRDIVTKRIPARVPILIVAFANSILITLGGLVLALLQGIDVPEAWQVGYLAIAAVFLSLGYLFMVATLRLGDLSATAPYRYTIMLFAIISGIVVFHEFPDWLSMIGMALVAAAGLYAAQREARLKNTSGTQMPSGRLPIPE
jgi:drug/metabolite transporter (DMT)-like permease